MPKGIPNKKYTAEFKIKVVETMLEDIRARAKSVIEDEDGERQRYLAIKANERKQQTEDES